MTRTGSDKPSYYAVIPANVRYDPQLSGGAKLLYGEITALSNKKGYCWATNEHFGELYSVHHDTVGTWLKELIDAGHLTVSGSTNARRIHMAVKTPPSIRRKDRQVSGENTAHNNTREYYKRITDTDATAKAVATVPFSLDDTLKKWESGKSRRFDILAWYFRKARFIARSKKELDNLINRHIRAATKLEVYTDDEIVDAWAKAKELSEKLNFSPTLETVLKQLTQ